MRTAPRLDLLRRTLGLLVCACLLAQPLLAARHLLEVEHCHAAAVAVARTTEWLVDHDHDHTLTDPHGCPTPPSRDDDGDGEEPHPAEDCVQQVPQLGGPMPADVVPAALPLALDWDLPSLALRASVTQNTTAPPARPPPLSAAQPRAPPITV